MTISFTGSEVIKSRFIEGKAFPDSDAAIAFRFTNEGNADLNELRQALKNKPQDVGGNLATFHVSIKNEEGKGVTKKFLLNGIELPVNEENSNIFSFFGRKMKESQGAAKTDETKTVTSHLCTEIKIAMNKLFHINESETENLSKRIEGLAKRLG